MKTRFIYIACIAAFCSSTVFCQSLEVGYGDFGTMIYWKGAIPKSGKIEIKRTRTDQSEVEGRLWTIRPAQDVDEFMANTRKVPIIFKDRLGLSEKAATFYLEKMREATMIESIPMIKSPNVLFALGFAVWDSTVVRDANYRYQIVLDGNPVGDGVTLQTTLPEPSKWSPAFFSGTNDERVIRCRWYIPDEKQSEIYSFLAYRTEPFKPNFQLVDGITSFFVSGDSIMAVFMDTLARETPGVYQYMIRTFDRFGRLGIASEYGEGSNFAPAAEPLITYFKATGLTDRPAIELKWKLLNPWRIRSLALYRGRAFDGPYELIQHVSSQDTAYLDPVTDVMEAYYYYFEMDDIAQDSMIRSTVAMNASEYKWPAETPDSVEISSVEGSSITIQWKSAGFQDRGYYVLRTQGYGTPKDIVSPLILTERGKEHYAWTDTTDLLADQYYTYAVISESIGFVKSPISETVAARPDVPVYIAPPTDVHISRQTDTTFLMSWTDQSADESNNHFGYRVYQKDSTAKDGYRLLTPEFLRFETNYLVLTNITPKDVFIVRSYNIFGNESADSESASYEDAFFYKFGPEFMMGQNEEKGIRVRWNHPVRTDIASYALYRIAGDGKKAQIATLKGDETNYLDTKIKSGETYYYFITADTQQGLSSEASDLVAITR